ncbi:hypothetical protein [Bradyrhizobium embrapense]|uniref:hypothetical protein n=1 Tax=Bradyrhizobium embrapense TaxID=630921 RepID=UPI00067C4C03|nr:hypothetical protein [Bradyrhizobium embrapense]
MINVSLRSEIMKDYIPGSEISGDRDIAAAMQKDGTLLLFSVGVNEHVYMLTKAPGSSTGWERTDLSADLPAGLRTLHLCAAQAVDGSPILAIATAPQSGDQRTVYVATDFTPTPRPKRWSPRGSRSGVEITAMTTGSTADGRPVVAVATVDGQRRLSTFFLHPDPKGGDTIWKEVPLPLNGSGVVDMAIGHNAKLEAGIPGLEGLIYTLLRIDDATTRVIVTSFPDFSIYNHAVPVTISPTALAAIGLPSGDTQLFLGTDSLYGLSPDQQMTQDAADVSEASTRIASMGPDASALAMAAGRHPDGRLEIWWLTSNGILSFVEEKPAGGWGHPIALQKQIGEMTAWRNPVSGEIDLFTVDEDHSLTHLAQDKTTTLWSARSILLPVDAHDLTKTVECDAYTTQITLNDADGFPLANQTVKISASSLSLVSIDGSHYFVDQSGQAATVETNALGMLSVATVAKGLATPRIRIAGDFIKEAIDFDPKAVVGNRLKKITADDLKGATITRGKKQLPLIPSHQSGKLDDAAKSLQQLVKVQTRLSQPGKADDVTVDVGDAGPQAYDIQPLNSAVATPLDVSHLQNGVVLTLRTAAAAPGRLGAPEGIFDTIDHAFGDAWQAVTNGLFDVEMIVIEKVDDGLRIVIHGLKSAYSAVVKFAEQVWSVIEWVFHEIGALIDELIMWLSFLFDWDDILNTHEVMRTMAQLSLKQMEVSASTAATEVATALDVLRAKVVGQKLSLPAGGVSHMTIAAVAKTGNGGDFTRDPKTSWIIGKLNRHTLGRASATYSDLPPDSITGLLKGVGEDEIKAIQAAFEDVASDIVKNIRNFNLEEIFQRMVAAFTGAVIETAKNIVVAICDVTALAVKAVSAILNAHIDIPVITWIYENIVARGSKLTILDASCLIAAIPATIACKLAPGFKRAPFSGAQADALSQAGSLDAFEATLRAQFGSAPRASFGLQAQASSSGSLPWEATVTLSYIAAAGRFLTAVLTGLSPFAGDFSKFVKLFLAGLKLFTCAISFVTTLTALAKNEIVSVIERLVLVDIMFLAFLSLQSATASAEQQDGLSVVASVLGEIGAVAVSVNFIIASVLEKGEGETDRGLKFGMMFSSFFATRVAPLPAFKDNTPMLRAYFYIAKSVQVFLLLSSTALNVARSYLSTKAEVPYVDV